MEVSTDELTVGETVQRTCISPKRCVWIDDCGKRYKSSFDVRAPLAFLFLFLLPTWTIIRCSTMQ